MKQTPLSVRDRVDPEVRVRLDAFAARFGPGGLNADADLEERRARLAEVASELQREFPASDRVTSEDFEVPGPPGAPDVALRAYRPEGGRSELAGIYCIHGGGMTMGSIDTEDPLARTLAEQAGAVVVSVEYRLAPEHPHPAPVEDCYAGLVWVAEHADELGIDAGRLAIYGLSAGGGLAAATTLLARDRGGPRLAFQLLGSPMLDDRNDTPSSREITDLGIWDRSSNLEAWRHLLGDLFGTDQVSPYAAPARADDLSGMPPAYIEVGELDLFRDEDIQYAVRLMQAGVPAELHVYPGAVHGAELIAPASELAARITSHRRAALGRALTRQRQNPDPTADAMVTAVAPTFGWRGHPSGHDPRDVARLPQPPGRGRAAPTVPRPDPGDRHPERSVREGSRPEPGNRLPVSPRCRVIVDNDYQGDPDGLVALAHHLVSPANHVVAVTSSLLNPPAPHAAPRAQDAAALASELLDVVGGIPDPPIHAGSEQTFGDQSSSAASTAIVDEARKDDHLPLYLACGGPLTNVASALRDAPDIASRLTLIWIGGSLDNSAFEYNRDTDKAAAAFVFEQQDLEIHQFPLETYRRCAYSIAELEHDLRNTGLLGHWLWSRFTNPPDWVGIGGVWPLGDSPTVLVTALSTESSAATILPPERSCCARRRIYTDVDFRLIVADMLARFRLHQC